MYCPQLTIPGFDDELADVFDELMKPDRRDAYQMPGYDGRPDTTDGQDPLCGELIAWRHPTFGNYQDRELAYSFVRAYNSHYSRHLYNEFECLAWILSSAANWMPVRLRDTLIDGIRQRGCLGWSVDVTCSNNAFTKALYHHPRSKFKFTREIRSAINELFTAALKTIGVEEDARIIAARFIDLQFVAGFYDEEERLHSIRVSRNKQHP